MSNTATIFEFVSRSFTEERGELQFSYRIHFTDREPLDFSETIAGESFSKLGTLPDNFKNYILEDLHLILGISYYKLFCPPRFKTDIRLSMEQVLFWNTIYIKGLSEFVYINKLDTASFAQFETTDNYERPVSTIDVERDAVLVGIGGGKDSIVSLELLKDYKRSGFILETGKEYGVARAVAEVSGAPLVLTKRTLDPKLYKGVPGSYGGHLPISIIYAFIGVLEAALNKQAYVVVSNEYSSSFGTIVEDGTEVNHQWSKSIEFEQMFQDYVATALTSDIRYFSLLRPFYELRIVEEFTKIGKKYFHIFSSCNRNFAHTHDGKYWCCECPKCAFAFLMLAAFLPPKDLLKIFPKNLLDDKDLLPLYKDLLGFGTMKPFDCVGTFEESQMALSQAESMWGEFYIVKELKQSLKNISLSTEIFKVQQVKTVPSKFRFLGMRSALILGYAREGQASESWLKNNLPQLTIDKSDQTDGPDYLSKQDDYDLVIKTAGLPGKLVKRQYTTATNIFFSSVPRENIIGVTGSKGKSTTSTLIFEMLVKAGKKARLVGNIGIPMLDSLLEKAPDPDELFVVELSSYQLEDLDVSPGFSVVTSLFPEHLDYHGSRELYYNAKRNITRFQHKEDVLIVANSFPELAVWSQETNANILAPKPLSFVIANKSLRGDHMLANASLAYTAASYFGVTDDQVKTVLDNFIGLPHRLMHIGTYGEIEFYDDSISTTPESAIAAIKALQNVDTIILGGVDRGYDFSELEKTLREYNVRNLVLFPDSGTHMLVSESGFNILHTKSMSDAVEFAYRHTQKGKSCVLSPAAPSYNLFKNFEKRGDAFAAAVKVQTNLMV